MMFRKILMLLSAAAALSAASGGFDLPVTRLRTLRGEPGNLHIDEQGVAYRSANGKTSFLIRYPDLREADVADPQALRFETYEVAKWKPIERRGYTFRAQPDAPVAELAQFLAARVHRPVVGHYPQNATFRIAAYHRRTLHGTSGMLEIGQDSIQFLGDNATDSRTWLYRDIETIGRPDSFRFRVTTNRETYVLELKESLPDEVYQFAWKKLYNL